MAGRVIVSNRFRRLIDIVIPDVTDAGMDKERRRDCMIAAEPVGIGIRDSKPLGSDRIGKTIVRVVAVVALL